MRVAALYDVHANLAALEAVLADVERERVDAIVFGGDLVSGPFPAETFDLAASLTDARFLRGNADRLVVERDPEYSGLGAWCADRLGDQRLAAVSRWPLTLELDLDGLGRTLFCHAVPADDEPIFTRLTPEDEVRDLLGDVDADVVVCGHTHVQFDRTLETGLRVINAGSVGMPYQGQRGAFWALLGPEVELRRTQYDVDAAVPIIRATGAPVRDDLTGWLLEPPTAEDASAFFESQRTAARGA